MEEIVPGVFIPEDSLPSSGVCGILEKDWGGLPLWGHSFLKSPSFSLCNHIELVFLSVPLENLLG
jgi:hypothetical protein